VYTEPSVEKFKEFFVRDFPYGCDIESEVLDSDINRAITTAKLSINQDLFVSQEEFDLGALLLSAHYLVTNIRSSNAGLAGTSSFLVSSKSVGSVSQSVSIPQSISENPLFAAFMGTSYGTEYLLMIYPRLAGNVFTVGGGTTA